MNGLFLISPNSSITQNCSNVTRYPYFDNNACLESGQNWAIWYIFEEAADTFFFCMGMLYLFNVAEIANNKEKLATGKAPDFYSQIPLILSAQTGLLALGMSYAFPTANHGLHVTIFNYWLAYQHSGSNVETGARFLGALLGTFTVLVFYWVPIWIQPFLDTLNDTPKYYYNFLPGLTKNTVNGKQYLYSRMNVRPSSKPITAVYLQRPTHNPY